MDAQKIRRIAPSSTNSCANDSFIRLKSLDGRLSPHALSPLDHRLFFCCWKMMSQMTIHHHEITHQSPWNHSSKHSKIWWMLVKLPWKITMKNHRFNVGEISEKNTITPRLFSLWEAPQRRDTLRWRGSRSERVAVTWKRRKRLVPGDGAEKSMTWFHGLKSCSNMDIMHCYI